MDETLGRLLVVFAIFLGIVVRTLAPLLRKKTLADFFKMELTWLYTAAAAFGSTWITILIVVPTDFDIAMQIVIAFFLAFGQNSVLNEMVKWKAVATYVKTGEKPPS